ncbi:DEAD/DEAH box helicase [Shewanella vesiculosa]|uniref:DEAD/DEAH box helicase n=1 Tax=Shewanella vesiculosa TaxID=518738 RepID=A0ABV0FUN2_9GAMM
MKPEKRTRFAAAITLSKGKMYEYGIPVEDHLEFPKGLDLDMQFPLAIGTLGDIASETVGRVAGSEDGIETPQDEIIFSAQVLQAFDESLLNRSISFNLRLLSAAGFYLGNIPGNAAVQISRLSQLSESEADPDPFAKAVRFALDKPWVRSRVAFEIPRARAILVALQRHYATGLENSAVVSGIRNLRNWAYSSATAHELLMSDLLGAVAVNRIANSAWTLIPQYSELAPEIWRPYLSRALSIKEMWPSQRMLGEAGLYRGQSSVVQMPTSTGKSRATELVIRSAFLSSRTKLALVIAPFRALCQEIASDLDKAFKDDGYSVNQVSDALQLDIDLNILGLEIETKPQVVVLTPEKLLFLLRQEPDIVSNAGLVVYDEGHQFDTGTRGVTYELLLTSIKRILSEDAQSVLISAVIQNASAVANWLLEDQSKVVADNSMQSRRLVAFASIPKNVTDGQLQFNVLADSEQSFYVPRVIVSEKMPRLKGERKDRLFPTKESGSIALYLALLLLKNGGVAIYAGKKASVAKIVRDAVEDTFLRGISLPSPLDQSDPEEIRRFVRLYSENFGDDAYLTKAAGIGIFAHHGNTPQGVRLAIEHAMRQRLIRLIVCTSTLAQGVNLPIRYLLVTSAMVGRESIRVRDFHNLMGRAGRAGMYGEGTVIFTDHRLYDERSTQSYRWSDTVNLIKPDTAESTGSTLLSLFDPMTNDSGRDPITKPSPSEIATQIVDNWDGLWAGVGNISEDLIRKGYSVASLRAQLGGKKKIVEAVESFLMTYRSDVDSETFVANAKVLSSETLAYSLATPEQQMLLSGIFESVARRIEKLVPDTTTQHRFGRTLLGIDYALAIDTWVSANEQTLEEVSSASELFKRVWPLLVSLSTEKRLHDTTPNVALGRLATGWLEGHSFAVLLQQLDDIGAKYPHGANFRTFDLDLVVDLCEQTFGFEFALLLAAVKEAFLTLAAEEIGDEFRGYADLLQKRLKYGLPGQEPISYYEAGFSERVIAQHMALTILDTAETSYEASSLIRDNLADFELVLHNYPSYFRDVFQGIVAPLT